MKQVLNYFYSSGNSNSYKDAREKNDYNERNTNLITNGMNIFNPSTPNLRSYKDRKHSESMNIPINNNKLFFQNGGDNLNGSLTPMNKKASEIFSGVNRYPTSKEIIYHLERTMKELEFQHEESKRSLIEMIENNNRIQLNHNLFGSGPYNNSYGMNGMGIGGMGGIPGMPPMMPPMPTNYIIMPGAFQQGAPGQYQGGPGFNYNQQPANVSKKDDDDDEDEKINLPVPENKPKERRKV